MEYIILTEVYESSLITRVNEHLLEGWELYGSPFSTGSNVERQYNEYGQAMIRKNANPTTPTL